MYRSRGQPPVIANGQVRRRAAHRHSSPRADGTRRPNIARSPRFVGPKPKAPPRATAARPDRGQLRRRHRRPIRRPMRPGIRFTDPRHQPRLRWPPCPTEPAPPQPAGHQRVLSATTPDMRYHCHRVGSQISRLTRRAHHENSYEHVSRPHTACTDERSRLCQMFGRKLPEYGPTTPPG